MEKFLDYLREAKRLSETTINLYKYDVKGYLRFINLGKPTRESVIAYSRNNQIKYRLNNYCKYLGYEFFDEKPKIDKDILNFIATLNHTKRTNNGHIAILQKYKDSDNPIEVINSYKEGKTRERALKIINQFRKYKKQKQIKLTSEN